MFVRDRYSLVLLSPEHRKLFVGKGNWGIFRTEVKFVQATGALVAQWLALLTSDLEGLGSKPG
jgi:hypothetical protein